MDMIDPELQSKLDQIKATCRSESESNPYALPMLTAIEGLEDWQHLSPVQITLEVIVNQWSMTHEGTI